MKLKLPILASVASLLLAGVSTGVSQTIQNPSFETPTAPTGNYTLYGNYNQAGAYAAGPSPWNVYQAWATAAVQGSGSQTITGETGSQYLQLMPFATVLGQSTGQAKAYQDLGVTYASLAGKAITLTADFGVLSGGTFASGSSLNFYNSALTKIASTNISSVTSGSFTTFSLAYTPTGSEAAGTPVLGNTAGHIVIGVETPSTPSQVWLNVDNFTLTVAGPPTIATEPASQTNGVGGTVAFNVVAAGQAPFSYQWQAAGVGAYTNLVNGPQVSGSSSNVLTISSLTTNWALSYRVIVSNSNGSVTSTPAATLTVSTSPTITTEPASQSTYVGLTVSFNVAAAGSAPLNYRWKAGGVGSGIYTNLVNGPQITGATSNVLTISSMSSAWALDYVVVVTNSQGAVTSAPPATLTLLPGLPLFRLMPLGDSITRGATDPNGANTLSGFRDRIYTRMTSGNVNYLFVGATTLQSSPQLISAGQQYHNGYGSYTTGDLYSNLVANVPPPYGDPNVGGYWMTSGSSGGASVQVDVVILLSGANDIYFNGNSGFQAFTNNEINLLGWFKTNRPATKVIVATDIPRNDSYSNQVLLVNQWITNVVPTLSANFSTVDMYPLFIDANGAWKTSSSPDGIYLYDAYHPSHNGYMAMGDVWFSAIEGVVNPTAPNNLSAASADSQVALSWSAVTGALGYNVKRSLTNGGPYSLIASNIPANSFTNTSLINGSNYFYVVSTMLAGGESPNSYQVSAMPLSATPAAITIANWSFESDAAADGSYSILTPAGWSVSGPSAGVVAMVNPGGSDDRGYGGSPAGLDGNNYCQIYSTGAGDNGTVYQDTGFKYQAGATYTLTAAFGRENSAFPTGTLVLYNSSLTALASVAISSANLTLGAFTDFSVTYTATGSEGDIVVGFNVVGAAASTSFDFDNVRLTAVYPTAPAITTQPVSQTSSVGATAAFNVVAAGQAPLSYQWQAAGAGAYTNLVNGPQVSGSTSNILTISNVTTNWALSYRVIVTNSLGSVTSTPPATLTVNSSSTISNSILVNVQFRGTSGGPGGAGNAQTGVAVLGFSTNDVWNQESIPYYVQTATPISAAALNYVGGGASGITLTAGCDPSNPVYGATDAGTASDPGTTNLMQTDIEVFNNYGTPAPYWNFTFAGLSGNAGSPFTLVVYAAAPSAGTETITLTAGATGGNTSGTLTTSSTSRKLSDGIGVAYHAFTGTLNGSSLVVHVTGLGTGQYGVGAYVNGFQLQIVLSDPAILTPPASQATYAGQTNSFSVTASGNSPLSYQWQAGPFAGTGPYTNLVNGPQISGAATNVLTIANVSSNWALAYRVIVSDSNGSVTSTPPATLTILPGSPSTVANANFDYDTITGANAPQYQTVTPTGWTWNGAGVVGLLNPAAGSYSTSTGYSSPNVFFSFSPDGVANPGISQTLTTTLNSNTTYKLSVQVGTRTNGVWGGYHIALQTTGGTVVGEWVGVYNNVAAVGNFATSARSFTTGPNPPGLGQPLVIVLSQGAPAADSYSDFDSVSLVITPATPHSQGAPIDVYVCSGQSNAHGWYADVAALSAGNLHYANAPDPRALFSFQCALVGAASYSTGSVGQLSPEGAGHVGNFTGFGPELSAGSDLAARFGKPVACLKFASGGANLDTQFRKAANYLYPLLITQVTNGLQQLVAQGYTPTLKGFFWLQGETDASQNPSTYATDIAQFVSDVRADLHAPALQFICTQINSNMPAFASYQPGVAQVNLAMSNLTNTDPNVKFVTTEDITSGFADGSIHYTADQTVTIGQRWAAIYTDPNLLAPTATVTPAATNAQCGGNLTFTANATGAGTLGYQWYDNQTNAIPGATGATLLLTNLHPAQAGAYTVVVTNLYGAGTNSGAVNVVDTTPPVILTQPSSQTNNAGSNVTFTVSATACSALSYQWYFNMNTALASQTNSTLTIASVSATNAGSYSVLITSAGGQTNSQPAVLTVLSGQSQPPVLISGQTLPDQTFQLTLNGPGNETYRVLASTNVAVAISNWVALITNTFPGVPTNYTDTAAPNYGSRVYRVQAPAP